VENDYKLEVKNEYFNENHHSGLRWFILVTFNNNDKIKIPCTQYASLKDMNIDAYINKYRLKERIKKINKIKCKIN